jgi:hypothetical protein
MARKQADAIAQAIFEPHVQALEETRRQRAQHAAKLAAQRQHVAFALVGYAVAAAVGHFAFGHIAMFGIAGAFAGLLVSFLAKRLRKPGAV